jgi:hypothetical protein
MTADRAEVGALSLLATRRRLAEIGNVPVARFELDLSGPESHKSVTLRVTLQPTNITITAGDIASTRTEVLFGLWQPMTARSAWIVRHQR